MSLSNLLDQWKSDPSIAPNITAWQVNPSRKGRYSNLPEGLDISLRMMLAERGISKLYRHQLESWELLRQGNNVVLATGTASGKSLAYQLPILNAIQQDPTTKALLLFPTKALAHDQLKWLNEFHFSCPFAYDGDTPSQQRKYIRQQAGILISNPDMLHLGILPYHPSWIEFFQNLKFIVVDEIHVYRGIFGSHLANVLRRLKRLTTHYGAQPQFILTSATIGNPQELAENLTEEKYSLIAEDHSSRGEKHFLVYNPPQIDPRLGLRASMQRETINLSTDLLKAGMQTIIFGRSRRSVEFMLSRLKDQADLPDSSLKAYRSGYLPAERRHIETGLRSGKVRAICATTALELGIDIGGLDSALLAGYPGTVAGTLQQTGRAGRTEKPSVAVLVASSSPLDQYLAHHPEYLFQSNPENGLIDPNNLLIVLAHLQCAAYELPFTKSCCYGSFTASQTQELLNALQALGKLHHSGDSFYWIGEDYPASEISLRSASMDQILLQVIDPQNTSKIIGTVDYDSALWLVHPGAIYLHSGEIYRVEELDLENKTALLSPTRDSYYTIAEKQTDFALVRLSKQTKVQGGEKSLGEINVRSQVTGYKTINWHQYQVLGRENLNMPATDLNTMGFWLSISEESELALRDSGLWNSSPNDYGPNWDQIRSSALTRDQHRCVNCGKSSADDPLHVHHKQPLRTFPNHQDANRLSNLITLCHHCHQRAESIVRVNSGLRGLGYIFHSLAPLLLMCDPGDIGFHTEFQSPFAGGRPTIMLYELIPAGVGFSRHLFQRYSTLLEMAYQAVSSCNCEAGCPSCVGPGGEQGAGGKLETLAILSALYLKQLPGSLK